MISTSNLTRKQAAAILPTTPSMTSELYQTAQYVYRASLKGITVDKSDKAFSQHEIDVLYFKYDVGVVDKGDTYQLVLIGAN